MLPRLLVTFAFVGGLTTSFGLTPVCEAQATRQQQPAGQTTNTSDKTLEDRIDYNLETNAMVRKYNLDVKVEQTRREILKELDPNFDPGENTTETSTSKQTIPVSSPTETPKTASTRPPVEGIDLTKRYDVYCSERPDVMVVYRNVLFKGMKKLVREDRDDLGYFYELEQADGSILFVAKYSVVKFCLPGTTPNAENISGKP